MAKVDILPRTAAALIAGALSLGGCAHTKSAATMPVQSATTCPEIIEAQRAGMGVLLQRLYPDLKQHHSLVTARSTDDQGNAVLDMTIWPLSEPQEPAPGHKVRLVMQACSMKPISAAKLPD